MTHAEIDDLSAEVAPHRHLRRHREVPLPGGPMTKTKPATVGERIVQRAKGRAADRLVRCAFLGESETVNFNRELAKHIDRELRRAFWDGWTAREAKTNPTSGFGTRQEEGRRRDETMKYSTENPWVWVIEFARETP